MSYDKLFKIIVSGASGVGKTSMLQRFVGEPYEVEHQATIGIEFKLKYCRVQNRIIKLQIWDMAGQDRFESIVTSYFRGADGVICVYDVSQPDTLGKIRKDLRNMRDVNSKNPVIYLVGNKTDLPNGTVSETQALKLLEELEMDKHFLTSVKNNDNVEKMVQQLAEDLCLKNGTLLEIDFSSVDLQPPPGMGCCGI